MELRLHHIIDHLYNIFLENDGSENCAQLLDEEVNKMFGAKYLNDAHDCNVVSMNSLNIQNVNDDCIGHDNDVSYKNVKFCRVNWECNCTPKRNEKVAREAR